MRVALLRSQGLWCMSSPLNYHLHDNSHSHRLLRPDGCGLTAASGNTARIRTETPSCLPANWRKAGLRDSGPSDISPRDDARCLTFRPTWTAGVRSRDRPEGGRVTDTVVAGCCDLMGF